MVNFASLAPLLQLATIFIFFILFLQIYKNPFPFKKSACALYLFFNLEEIYAHNLDYYMIGPYDLSASLGITAKFDNPLFLESIEKVKRVITNPSQMAVHIPTDVQKHIDKYDGYGIIAIGMDTSILLEGYKELYNA